MELAKIVKHLPNKIKQEENAWLINAILVRNYSKRAFVKTVIHIPELRVMAKYVVLTLVEIGNSF